LLSILHGALFKKISVTEDGRLRTMSRMEAMVTGQIAKALKGDTRATESMLKLANQYLPAGDAVRPVQLVVLKNPKEGEPSDD
jgi:hypothetical protein